MSNWYGKKMHNLIYGYHLSLTLTLGFAIFIPLPNYHRPLFNHAIYNWLKKVKICI